MLRRCIEEIKENGIRGSLAELGVYKGEFAKYFNSIFQNANYIFSIHFLVLARGMMLNRIFG